MASSEISYALTFVLAGAIAFLGAVATAWLANRD